MNNKIVIRPLEIQLPYEQEIEIVERKGLGHPDTLCDHLAERVSIALCNLYLSEFDIILHHNVDKALLVGGYSEPAYKGGKVIKPIEVIISGRATNEYKGKILPVEEVAEKAIEKYLGQTIRNLDVEKAININIKIRPGSSELTELFERKLTRQMPLSNDTSIGTGFYPFDETESLIYKIEQLLNSDDIKVQYPFIGEDIKVMGVRNKDNIEITLAVAMIDRYIDSLNDYKDKIIKVETLIKSQGWFCSNYRVQINTADNYENESIYSTVTGTSAENGDDGQVGRGNRANGLITPYRPMTLEAVAGKNPINHVGKLYNLFANELSKTIVENGYARECCVTLVSQIGKPINEPQIIHIVVKDKEAEDISIADTCNELLRAMPFMWKDILQSRFSVA